MALTKIKLNTMVTGNLPDANIPDTITVDNSATATALETARTIHGVSFDGTANIDLTEAIQDVVGGMVSSNTETNIAVTYDDTNGKLDFVSTDTNTTYSVGDGGLTQNNFTNTLKSKLDGIASSANNYSLPLSTSSARGGVKIGYSENGKNYPVELDSEKMYVNVPWTDTNTTYSVGDGGLTQNNFTNTLKSKLDGIETGATADQDLSGYAALSGATFTGDILISGNRTLRVGGNGSETQSTFVLGGSNSAGSRVALVANSDSSYLDAYGGEGSTERYRDFTYAARSHVFRTGAGSSVGTAFTIDSSQNVFANNIKIGSTHLLSSLSNGNMRITGTNSAAVGINLYASSNSRGWVYANDASQIGFLNTSGSWDLRKNMNGELTLVVSGSDRTVIHSGNVNAQQVTALEGHDTRSVTTTPQSTNAGVRFDFKNNSTNGLNDGGGYHGLMTYRQYGGTTDWSGGHAHQIGFTDNTRLYHRSGTGTSYGSWYKVHSQRDMPSSGYNGADVTLRTNSNGYLTISNWIDVTSHGIYSSNINGFHFLPNQTSTYGSGRIIGSKGGWGGITGHNGYTTLMMDDNTIGLYNDYDDEWVMYGQRNSHVYMYYNGGVRFRTNDYGVDVYGQGEQSRIYEGNNKTLELVTNRNSAEFHVGENGYTYGNFSLRGSSNSYQGITFPIHSDYPTVMFENSLGSGGFYYQGSDNKWAFFWHNGNDCAGIGASTTSNSYKLYVSGNTYTTGSYGSSDLRLKENIKTIDNPLDKVMKMRGVYFDWKDEHKKEKGKDRQTGVIAQEINKVLPEVVQHAEDLDEYSVEYGHIAGVLIESIKELKNEINELKKGCCNGS